VQIRTMSSGSSGSRVAKPAPVFFSICDLRRRILGLVNSEAFECGVVHTKWGMEM
jgi:hypothetical protein